MFLKEVDFLILPPGGSSVHPPRGLYDTRIELITFTPKHAARTASCANCL